MGYEGAMVPSLLRHEASGRARHEDKRRMNIAICATVWPPGVAARQMAGDASIATAVQHTLVSRRSGAEARILRGMAKRATASARARAVPEKALVSIVDDDESVRESLPDLLRELGFA